MKTHGEILRDSGMRLVRLDVESPQRDGGHTYERARTLSRLGLQVMGIVHSDWLAPYRGPWETRWREYIGGIVQEFGQTVDYWQVENELNHPYHSFHPSLRRELRRRLIAIGCGAVKEESPEAKTVVNMYSYLGFGPWRLGYLNQLVALAESGIPIDVLGIDVYRGTYAPGGPSMYCDDLRRAERRWQRDIIVAETGFPAPWLWRPEEAQSLYFRELFRSIHDDGFVAQSPWFLGTLLYVYGLDRPTASPEDHFGLMHPDGRLKASWATVVDEARRLRGSLERITLGVTSHVDERLAPSTALDRSAQPTDDAQDTST